MLRNQLTAPPSIPWWEEDQRRGEGWRGDLSALATHRTPTGAFSPRTHPPPCTPPAAPPPQQMAAEPRPPSRGQQLTRRLVHSLGGSEHLELRG